MCNLQENIIYLLFYILEIKEGPFTNLRKKLLIGLILLILIINCSNYTSGYHKPFTKPEVKDTSIAFNDFLSQLSSRCNLYPIPYPPYEPQDIDLRDAAYHKSYDRLHMEWWFLEDILDNGYSTAFTIIILSRERIFSKGNIGSCFFAVSLYKDTELEFSTMVKFPLENLIASQELPLIKISEGENSFIMEFDNNRSTTDEWIFNVSFIINDTETNVTSNLTFTGTTKGYAGQTLGGWYGPILPKADVKGVLILNNEEINMNGLGYLEHGWNITFPIWEYGWYFGKIVSDSFCLLWGRMMQTRWNEQGRAAILSKDGSGYININPKNFSFKPTNYKFNNGKLIPTKYIFNITDSGISINVTIETININHFGIASFDCWRYHVLVNGQITYGNTTEIIKNKIQLMGFVSFR